MMLGVARGASEKTGMNNGNAHNGDQVRKYQNIRDQDVVSRPSHQILCAMKNAPEREWLRGVSIDLESRSAIIDALPP